MKRLSGKTVFISGSSRGIGREIALRCASDGANVVIAAKSDVPHPKLDGTIYTVAEEVENAGGSALPVKLDVRDGDMVEAVMCQAADHFGGIDVLINNASGIFLGNTQETTMRRFDLIHAINTRGTLLCSKAAIPYLKKSSNPHILTMSPPINLRKKWLGQCVPYTVTKYSMTLIALGLSEELRGYGVASNTLWPQTIIATAAVEFAVDARLLKVSRTPAIVADAAYEIIVSDSRAVTGQSFVDEAVLRERGYVDFDRYKYDPDCKELLTDIFIDS